MLLRDSSDESAESAKATKEHRFAEGREMYPYLTAIRDGDADTGIILDIHPGPTWWDSEVNPAHVILEFARIVIPGLNADQVTFVSDTYARLQMHQSRAHRRNVQREMERFGGSMQKAWDAGRADELDITEAIAMVMVERNDSPDRLPVMTHRIMPYRVDGTSIDWLQPEECVDDGLAASMFTGGKIAETLREAFASGDLMAEALEPEHHEYLRSQGIDFDSLEIEGHPEVARCHFDIALFRLLAERGAMISPAIPAGSRSDYIQQRLKSMAEELGAELFTYDEG
jgi:hypothetical protein